MAYEKYIKKDGKIYGPYIYHSKRVDGKVVSEYHGQKPGIGKFLLIIALAVLVVFGAYLIERSGKGATGYTIQGDQTPQIPIPPEIQTQTIQKTSEEVELTDNERAVLIEEFGDLSVRQEIKSVNNLIIVRYGIGGNWIEHSYYSNLDEETLKALMKIDRTKWLKDIAERLFQEKIQENSFEVSEVAVD